MREQPFPIVLTGPPPERGYFEHILRFVEATLGQ